MVGERILYVLIMLMSENKGGNDDDDDYKHHNCSCNHQFYAAFVSFVRSLSVRSFVHCLITIIHVLLFMFFLYYCRFVYVYMNLYSFFLCSLFCLYVFYNRHFRHRSSCVERERERTKLIDIFQIARSSS